MIEITPAAYHEVHRLQQRQKQPQALLRVDIRPSACAQWSYHLSLEPRPSAGLAEDDCLYNTQGVAVVISKTLLQYVGDLTIDFSEDLMGGAFRFNNSLATENCRCGYAFAIR